MIKERILSAALEVYLENPNATVYDVAKKAGVSKSAIFYHFKNKNNLEKELLIYTINKYSPWSSNNLRDAVRNKLKLIEKDKRIARMIFYLLDNIYKNDKKFIEDLLSKSTKKIGKLLEKEGVLCRGSPEFLMALLDGIAMYSMYGLVNPAQYKNAPEIIVNVLKEYSKNCYDKN